MRPVKPRSFRPRLLLLPLLFGVLVVPALLTASSPSSRFDIHAGAVCSNVEPRAKSVVKPRPAPSCVNCRAPLLNAPLARSDQDPPPIRVAALPPAA